MCPINDTQILIIGGYCVRNYYKGQGLILDTKHKRSEKVLGKQVFTEFEALGNQSRQMAEGIVAGLVIDINEVIHMVTFDADQARVEVVETIGKNDNKQD